jgi:hypothetical protein
MCFCKAGLQAWHNKPFVGLFINVLGPVALQVVGGIMRPTLNHARRPNWRAGHTLMGWLALAAGKS